MTAKQLKQSQADTWATRRRDGAKFDDIARDSEVTARTVYNRLREFGYDSNGRKEGGSGDQTTNPQSSTEADDLNSVESTATTSTPGGGK